MKIIVRFFVYGLIFLSLTSNAEVSSSFSQDQQDVIKFIQKFYAIPTNTYLYAEFNNEDNPKRHCLFLSKFLIKETLFKRKDGVCFVPLRYPSMYGEDATVSSDYPVPQIQVPAINDNLAEVLVLFRKPNLGRVRYYLKKTEDGWRIYKSRSDQSAHTPESRCSSFRNFPPGADEIKYESHLFFPELN